MLQLKFISLIDNLRFVEIWKKKSKDTYSFERLLIFVQIITINNLINLDMTILCFPIIFLLPGNLNTNLHARCM